MRRTISAAVLACPLIFATVAMAYPSARVADFSVSPQPAVRYSPTTFTSTERCVAAPCTYRWFHGDAVSTDQFGTGTIASFTYTGPGGTRTVTLKVIDRRNREAVRTRSFQLVEPSSPSPAAQCSDGRDNDGDGATDYPADAGCSSATDNDESNIVTPPTGFPSASSTGVPSGTTLTPGGGLTINAAGAVVDGREITGAVVVNAPNVTIRNSRIRSQRVSGDREQQHGAGDRGQRDHQPAGRRPAELPQRDRLGELHGAPDRDHRLRERGRRRRWQRCL